MPLFFFHLRTGEHLDEDTIGVDLADLDAARRAALAAIADLLRDASLTAQSCDRRGVRDRRSGRAPVLTVRIDALLGRALATEDACTV